MYKFELVRKETNDTSVIINTGNELLEYCRKEIGANLEVKEVVLIAYLNARMEIIHIDKHSEGGHSSAYVDLKILTKIALDCLASGVIMVHNHPSGSTNKSRLDIKTAKAIKRGLSFFGIKFIDTIIITKNDAKSFIDEC